MRVKISILSLILSFLRKLVFSLSRFISEWKQDWSRRTPAQKLSPLGMVGLYWLCLVLLNGLQEDHVGMGLLLLILSYGGPKLKVLDSFLQPFLWVAIIYDSQRFYAHWIRGPIHVQFPYWFDQFFFGIRTAQGILTPNEWLQMHSHPALDLITGFSYLIFISHYVFVSAYFKFWLGKNQKKTTSGHLIADRASQMGWTFLWVNLLGYSTYYWFPAAPPWYVSLYGLGPARLDTLPNVAGCIRFDQLLGTHFFSEMYGRSADVFGAIPSLHVAYPLIATLYAFEFQSLRLFCLMFYFMMCFSAVYLNHHYVLDILWGSLYVFLIHGISAVVRKQKKRSLAS